MRLFVYGSLRRGEPNHDKLRDARFLGGVRTSPCYALETIGEYPALRNGRRAVSGELYEIERELLDELDRFEGHPTLYARRRVLLRDGRSAWAYFAPSHQASPRREMLRFAPPRPRGLTRPKAFAPPIPRGTRRLRPPR